MDNTVTFDNLFLYDSTESVAVTLYGTIGHGMIDLIADVPTEVPWFGDIIEGDLEAPETYLVFNEDSTGMTIEIEEDEDDGYIIDTSYFCLLYTSPSPRDS